MFFFLGPPAAEWVLCSTRGVWLCSPAAPCFWTTTNPYRHLPGGHSHHWLQYLVIPCLFGGTWKKTFWFPQSIFVDKKTDLIGRLICDSFASFALLFYSLCHNGTLHSDMRECEGNFVICFYTQPLDLNQAECQQSIYVYLYTSECILLLLSAVPSLVNSTEPIPLAVIHTSAIALLPPCLAYMMSYVLDHELLQGPGSFTSTSC